ncbi:MAG: hypothetical protein ACM3S2_08825 [Ignavibacteriales bacterium]
MQVISFVWGVLAIAGMVMAFFPCLGAFNWLNVPFSAIGLVVSYMTQKNTKPGQPNRPARTGMYMCLVAVVLGIFRLIIGGGIL